MTIYQQSLEDLNASANGVKASILAAMEREGYVTPKNAKKFGENYAVIVYEKGFLGKTFSKLLGEDSYTAPIIRVVKIV